VGHAALPEGATTPTATVTSGSDDMENLFCRRGNPRRWLSRSPRRLWSAAGVVAGSRHGAAALHPHHRRTLVSVRSAAPNSLCRKCADLEPSRGAPMRRCALGQAICPRMSSSEGPSTSPGTPAVGPFLMADIGSALVPASAPDRPLGALLLTTDAYRRPRRQRRRSGDAFDRRCESRIGRSVVVDGRLKASRVRGSCCARRGTSTTRRQPSHF